MPPPTPEPPPTNDELKSALPFLFAIAAQCSTYHTAFSVFYPRESFIGAEVNQRPAVRQLFNAISEATLMYIRKSAEFFKPRIPSDRADTLHSYQFPGYTGQYWIVPRETYVEFHKRVGHLTLQEIRSGRVSWPIFELAMLAINKWAEFFGAMAAAYATEAETAAYCTRCAELLRGRADQIEREALQSRRNAAAFATEAATPTPSTEGPPPSADPQ